MGRAWPVLTCTTSIPRFLWRKTKKTKVTRQSGSILPEHSLQPAEGRRVRRVGGCPSQAMVPRTASFSRGRSMNSKPVLKVSSWEKRGLVPQRDLARVLQSPQLIALTASCAPLQSRGQAFVGAVPAWAAETHPTTIFTTSSWLHTWPGIPLSPPQSHGHCFQHSCLTHPNPLQSLGGTKAPCRLLHLCLPNPHSLLQGVLGTGVWLGPHFPLSL